VLAKQNRHWVGGDGANGVLCAFCRGAHGTSRLTLIEIRGRS
jgi:hypothetical protein